MSSFRINVLGLSIENAGGHEHRVQPIAARAAALFAERLEKRLARRGGAPGAAVLDSVAASSLDLHLGSMSDQDAASTIANVWLEAMTLKVKLRTWK
jgi:hypothetical protein